MSPSPAPGPVRDGPKWCWCRGRSFGGGVAYQLFTFLKRFWLLKFTLYLTSGLCDWKRPGPTNSKFVERISQRPLGPARFVNSFLVFQVMLLVFLLALWRSGRKERNWVNIGGRTLLAARKKEFIWERPSGSYLDITGQYLDCIASGNERELDRSMDGWMDRWIDGLMDRWMDGLIDG